MPSIPKRIHFFETEKGLEVLDKLRQMQKDPAYNTEDCYSPNSELYPDNTMPFMVKHKIYLIAHPQIDALSYLANLRLKTRLR